MDPPRHIPRASACSKLKPSLVAPKVHTTLAPPGGGSEPTIVWHAEPLPGRRNMFLKSFTATGGRQKRKSETRSPCYHSPWPAVSTCLGKFTRTRRLECGNSLCWATSIESPSSPACDWQIARGWTTRGAISLLAHFVCFQYRTSLSFPVTYSFPTPDRYVPQQACSTRRQQGASSPSSGGVVANCFSAGEWGLHCLPTGDLLRPQAPAQSTG
jgi:hypothetical protein